MTSFDFRPGINEEESFSVTTESGFDFRPGVQLPAAASDAAGVPPSPEEALPVDPVVPVTSGGRNNARVRPEQPEQPVAADEPFDIDAQIARNNEFAARVDDVLAGVPDPLSPSGRNDTSRFNTLAPEVGQDGVNPVSVFNPAVEPEQPFEPRVANPNQTVTPINSPEAQAEYDRALNVIGQLGPTRDKANLNVNPMVSRVDGVPGNYTFDVMGSKVPIDDDLAAQNIAYGNTYKVPNNSFLRGMSRANQAMALLGANLGLTDQSEAIKVITQLNRITPDQPEDLQKALREIVDADTWSDSLKAIANNPGAVLSVVAESLPMSATSLAVFITGSAAGTPITGSALAGLVTYGQVYSDVIISELRESGVNMNDDAAVQEMLSDPEFYGRAKERAGTYALPIAVFDALSMGLAGKIAGAAIKSGSKFPVIAGASLLDLGMQGGFGAAGEATAQLLELSKGFRDKISKGEIALEGIAEIPLGGVEVATGTAAGARQSRANREAAELQVLEERAATQAAIALQSPDMAQMAVVPDSDTAFDFRPDIQPAPVSAAIPATEPVSPAVPVPAADPTPETVAAPAVEPAEPEPVVAPAVEPVAAEPAPAIEPEPTPDPATVLARLAAEPDPEPAPAAEPAPAPAAEPDNPQAKPPLPFALKTDQSEKGKRINSVTTPDGETRIAVSVRIVDMADLKSAQGDLQPRDRSLDESAIEIQRRAANLLPGMLMPNNTTDVGAPIMARDGTIISGNGRVASIRQAYEQFPEKAAAYRAEVETYINRADNPSGVGYEMPVLVSMIDQDMTYQELVDLADKSNRSAIATMSATERAQRDAKAMDIEMVNLFQGGSMTSIENQAFRQNFIRSVVAPTEQNQMSRDGQLTKEGVQRMQNAILATAYEDTDALAIMLDSTDDNIKAISNAMLDAAPSFAKLKSDIAAGEVPSQFDISSKVTEAARKISDLRNRGIKPRDFFAQQDAFTEIDPDVEALIRAFYNDELTRAKSQRIMADVLKYYTEEAAQKKEGGFFEDTTTPRDVIELARRKADGTEGQGDLLADAEQRPSRSLNESGQQTQRATPTRSRQESGSKLSKEATEARRQRQAELKDEAARPSRAEVASEETVGATENTVLPISELSNQRTQKPGTLVDKEAMRKGSALQLQAFADAGVDPNRAINFPIERQFKILSDMMVDRFGFATVVKSEDANSKEAVDQLLVGYHNLTNLAANLGLPTKAFGLEGTLSFVLAKNIGAYGVYNPNTRAITLPKRSNSFAHEWFHALDHYLLDKYGNGENTNLPLASEAVRSHGTEAFGPDAPTSVQESYFALMRALFKDKASEAVQLQAINQKMAEIEARAAKAGKPVSEVKAYQKLEAQKKNILGSIGKSQKIGKTQMRKDAEFFAQISQSGVKYWTMPAEMAARSFEAFAVTQVTNAGLQTGFLGKSVEAYEMTLEQLGVSRDQLANPRTMADIAKIMDSRLALTFPKDQERVEIFGAYRNLMDAIARETVLGQGESAKEIGNDFVTDIREMHNLPENETRGLIADQMREVRSFKIFRNKQKQNISQYKQMHSGVALPFYLIEDAVAAPLFFQKQGQLKSIMRRYPANRSLRIMFENLGTHTGGKFQPTREGGNLLEAQARQVRVFSDRLKNVLNKHDVAGFNELETKQLHMILTSQDDLGSAPDKVVKAAGDFRAIYNQMYDYLRDSGLDIGYAPSGYVQRVLDHDQIAANPQKFMEDASKVYEIVYDEALGPLEADSLDYMLKTIQFIRDQKLGREVESDTTEGNETLGKEPAYIEFIKGPVWKRVTDARAQLRALQKAKKAKPDSVKDEAIDAAQAELDEAVAAAADDFAIFHSAMRSKFAEFSAFNWRQNIQQSRMGTVTDASPQAIFSKKRKLPAQADEIMDQFYINDPVEALTNYILAAVRKAEYSRRFGKHLLPEIANKAKYTDYLDYLLKQLENTETPSPITAIEAQEVKTTVNNILGRNIDDFMPSLLTKTTNKMSAALSLTLLVRAPIASIAEPVTVAMTTGSVTKGMHSLGQTFQEFPGLRKLSKNAAEDIRLRHQFARLLGIIDDPEVGDIITSRIGGEFSGDPALTRMLSKFFAKIKLSGITNAQRRSASKVGFQFMLEQAYEIRNPSSERNVARAKLVLKDLGVSQGNMEQFIDFVLDYSKTKKGIFGKEKVKTDALPEAAAIMDAEGKYTDMGLQLAVSVMRFVDQTIQDPRTADRPRWAEQGIGRIFYGIMSFIYSFQDKVLKAVGRKFKREYNISRDMGKGKAGAIGDAATWSFLNSAVPLLSLFAAHAVVSTAREYIFNQDRWDREWEENEEDPTRFALDYLIPLAFARSGLTGAFDPVYQAFTGLKYQRDLSNYFLGTGGYIVQNVQDIFSAFTSANSPNTVSSEFKAYRGAYNLTIQPLVSFALAILPLTQATAIPATGVAMYVSSTTVKNEIINTITEFFHGQRYEPGQRGRRSGRQTREQRRASREKRRER